MGFIKVKDSPLTFVHPDAVERIQSFVDAGDDKVRVTLKTGEEYVFPFATTAAMQAWFADLGNATFVLDWADYTA